MTEQLKQSMQRMDELIKELNHVNSIRPRGAARALQGIVLMERRRDIGTEMDEVNKEIMQELRKDG